MRSVHPLSILAILSMLAGCSPDDRLIDVAGVGGGGGEDVGSAGSNGPAGPGCEPGFREPDFPCLVPEARSPIWGDIEMQVIPDPDAHCGTSPSNYWVTGTEPLEFRVLARVRRDLGTWLSVEVMFLVDGRVVEAYFDGNASLKHHFVLHPGDQEFLAIPVSVPTDRLDCGAHSALMLAIFQYGESGLVSVFGWQYALMVNGTTFPEVRYAELKPTDGFGFPGPVLEDVDSGERFTESIPFDPRRSSRRLRLQFKTDPIVVDEESNVLLLAFIDGVQVPFGQHGYAPVIRTKPGEMVEIEWEQPRPDQQGVHNLVFVGQNAFGQPLEDERGMPTVDSPRVRKIAHFVIEGPPGPVQ